MQDDPTVAGEGDLDAVDLAGLSMLLDMHLDDGAGDLVHVAPKLPELLFDVLPLTLGDLSVTTLDCEIHHGPPSL